MAARNVASEDTFDFPYCDDVDKYERTTKIGKGTFGEVFRAKHKVTKKEVALKRILMDNEQEGFPITAIREIKLLRSYKDETVINLIEVCRSTPEINGKAISFYLVFDFCHHDLAGLIQNAHDKIKSLPNIKCIVKQLLEGLHKLHTNRIIHRDMKSSNILITKDGQLKIADFGLARPYTLDANRKYTNRVVTLWYRPPELLLGERNYACDVDLWGVGCIMSELFTGEALMKGSSEQHQLQLIIDNMGPITPEVWPRVVDLPLYSSLSNGLSRDKDKDNDKEKEKQKQREKPKKLLMMKMKRYTHNELALDLLRKLLMLDPSKRIDANAALDHDFFWDERDPQPADKKALAKSLSAISQSQFEYTTRHKRIPNPAANPNFVAQQMVNRGNNHRPIGHRPGPSNNDGQYRDHVY